ncbi:protein SOB FIVE-LIKE 5 [Nicotiana tabacum]|uniref:Protein SOB FIVE-LIKE 5 n=2 Tax=Nicotiana TaxID=4085 RepID=A0A1S4DBH0_TOBAC|nr:PREDICTED: uncharacterized protein LOC104218854 [Nicotiana sylvestris]XP_016510756.1 PREDICTED: uncharacterized protein LOC107828019 [Nicotiana tabacum]
MNISASECTNECESGWTMYFDEFSYSADKCNGVKGRNNIHEIGGRGKTVNVDDEDLSMVSDASSGPPLFHEDEENGHVFYPLVSEYTMAKQKRKIKEQSGKQHNLCLDDTASSTVSSFPKDTTGFYNDTTYMEQVAGYSGTYSKGKSAVGKHFGFLKTSLKGKASSEKSGSLKGRKKG